MKNCALCSTEMKFLNTPLLGSGKLNDGNELCTKCYGKMGNSVTLKKYSLADIHQLLQKKEIDATEKKLMQESEKKSKEERALVIENEKKLQKDEKRLLEEEQKKIKAGQKKVEMENYQQEKKTTEDQRKLRLEEIKSTIQNLKLDNISSFLGRKEINELPDILAANEQVDNIIQGIYNEGLGILVSTDRRLVFVDKGLLYGIKVEDFPLDKITSIQYETGILFGKVKIHTSGNIAAIEQVDKTAARKFSEFVREKMSTPKQSTVVVMASSEPDILGQLEKLGQLKEKGILSVEEFAEQKQKLLQKL